MSTKKIIFTISLITIIICLSIGFISITKANDNSSKQPARFDELSKKIEGFEKRAEQNQVKNVEKVEIKYPGNINKKIKKLEEMEGYIKDEALENGAKYIKKELLTYKEFINNYTEMDLDPSIEKDRYIYVTTCHYPAGYQHKRGFVENAISVQYYDAETGEFFGCSLKSLNKGGNKISRKPSASAQSF
ncbi:MAG: hypothetical protein N2645_00195 [Clostridia bacterium]|nr:hypothetical protein [Clostridia bacterium]